jgi:hypothetical protein
MRAISLKRCEIEMGRTMWPTPSFSTENGVRGAIGVQGEEEEEGKPKI